MLVGGITAAAWKLPQQGSNHTKQEGTNCTKVGEKGNNGKNYLAAAIATEPGLCHQQATSFGECLGIVWPHDFRKCLPQQVCKWYQLKGEQVEQRWMVSLLPDKRTQSPVPPVHSDKGSKPDGSLGLPILNVETAF